MEAHLILCDWAEEIGGKLYIMGGGWSQTLAGVPVTLGVAVMLKIPWNKANEPQKIGIALVTEDGASVPDPVGQPIRTEGVLEVGRPAGLKAGTDLDAALAIKVQGIVFEPGGYVVQLMINDQLEQQVAFRARGGPPGDTAG